MIFDNLLSYAARMPEIALAGVIFVFWLAALWVTINLITRFDDNEEIARRDNRAYAVSRGSLVAAHAIAMTFSIGDYTYQPGVFIQWEFLGWMMAEGLYIYLVLLLSRPIVDRLVLWKFNNLEMLRQGNLAVGFTEAGAYLGIGVLLGSSLVGTAGAVWLTIVSSFVFYLLGIAWQFAGFWIHEAITRYHLRQRLTDGHPSTGLETGGLLFAMSLAVSPAVAGDLDSWGTGIALFVLVAVCSFLLLYPIWLLLRTFGPGRSIHDDSDSGSSGLAGSIVNSIMVVMIGFCVNQLITVML